MRYIVKNVRYGQGTIDLDSELDPCEIFH
jgi:hypothetical protein